MKKNYSFGDIVLVQFTFSDSLETKRRPGLVLLDMGDEDVIVAKITTKPYYTDFDYQVKEWEKAGLLRPSTIRLHKINTIAKSFIDRKLGKLKFSDCQEIKIQLPKIWGERM